MSVFRHWFGNQYVTENAALTPADFDTYCITAPVDSRLPGGGGQQICGLYDVKPQKFGVVSNRVSFAKNFGELSEVYTGTDISLNMRLPRGSFLQGGATIGRTATDNCYAMNLPQLSYTGSATQPRTPAYCDVSPPLSSGTQLKFAGTYPLPWNLSAAATFQNVPGPQITAAYAVPTAVAAAGLGRSPNSAVTVDLIPAATLYQARINQVDLRVSRLFPAGRTRIKANFEIFNAFNSSGIQNQNNTFGPRWQTPTSILQGQLVKLGTQIEW
jgi:hypothetical protein